MARFVFACLWTVTVFAIASTSISTLAAQDDKASLQGVWVAQSLETEGKPDSGTDTRLMRMRFGFKGDKLIFAVNLDLIVERQFSYRIDATKSPKQIDITPTKPIQGETLLGVYALQGDELKVCLRYGRTHGGRPTEFSTKADSGLILMLFKRAKATRGVTQELRIPTFRPT